MRITGLELTPVRTHREMGRRFPADPERAVSEHVVVQLHTDGDVTGLGEMSDVNWEVTPAACDELRRRLERVVVGCELEQRGTVMPKLVGAGEWEHQVLCGIDIAVHDAVARHLELSVAELLGGARRQRVPFAYPLAPAQTAADVDANLARVTRRMDEGHTAFRYYFGVDLDLDETFLQAARDRWGASLRLVALDASGRFTPDGAIEALRRLEPFTADVFESPVRGRHNARVEDFLRVKEATGAALSEHIPDAGVAARLGGVGAVDVFNTGLGYAGIEACRETLAVAEQLGLRALMGSTVEMSIGTAARLQVAASVTHLDLPAYMAGPLVYEEDVTVERVRYVEGHLELPAGPGIGVDLDHEALRSLTI